MRTWLEINLKNLRYNLNKIREYSEGKKIIGVIKADAYGIGAIEYAKTLVEEKVELLAVACLSEAMELRNAGIEAEMLILGCIPTEDMEKAIENNIQITVNSMKEIKYLENKHIYAKVHININTGMGRAGFLVDEGYEAIKYINSKKVCEVLGIYSHLSVADEKEQDDYSLMQLKRFEEYEKMEGIKYRHILNSSGCIKFNNITTTNYVRPGILLHGIIPYDCIEQNDFKLVFTLKTKVLYLKKLKEEEYISYGKTYRGKIGEVIATLPIGYADGWNRRFSNGGKVEILGVDCEIVGRVCMDMCMVSIPVEIEDEVKIGTEVTLIGKGILKQAEGIETIPYELMTNIDKRVEKKYVY